MSRSADGTTLLAADAGEPADAVASGVQLAPGDLGSEHEQRSEVLHFVVAPLFALENAQDVPDEVLLQTRVGGGNHQAKLLEHDFAAGRTDHGRQARVGERLADLRGLVGKRRGDLDSRPLEHAVHRISDGVAGVANDARVGRRHHSRRHCHAGSFAHHHHHHHVRVARALHPGFLPPLEGLVEGQDGGPELIVQTPEQDVLAGLGDEVAVHAVDGIEQISVAATGEQLAQGEEFGRNLLLGLVGEGFHRLDQPFGGLEEAGTVGHGSADGGDHGRLVDLEDTAGAQGHQPGLVAGNRWQQGVDRHRADFRCVIPRAGGRGRLGLGYLDRGEQLAGRDGLHADVGEVAFGEHGQVGHAGDAQLVHDLRGDVFGDAQGDDLLEQGGFGGLGLFGLLLGSHDGLHF